MNRGPNPRPWWTPAACLLLAAALPTCDQKATASVREPPAEDASLPPVLELPSGEDLPPSPDLADVVARVQPSVVNILASRSIDDDLPLAVLGHPSLARREHAVGAGFVITKEGLALTNAHVIEGADEVRVRLFDRRTLGAAVIGRDQRLDVALLQIKGARALRPAVLGSSEVVRVGEPVFAIGNPFGLGTSVTRGIVSAKARSVASERGDLFLQTDAAINPGNSGGPLFDQGGRVVGINTAIVTHGRGVSFAVPIDDVRPVLDELRRTGRVARGRLGIAFQAVSPELARALRLPDEGGALVNEIEPKGPADAAGLAPGDVVRSFGGVAIERAPDLAHELGRHKPGEVVRIDLLRDGRPKVLDVKLDRLTDADDDEPAKKPSPPRPSSGPLGIRAADADGGGARIEVVDSDSPAADDLSPGDVVLEVNRSAVRSSADLASRLAAAPRPSTILFRLRRDGSYAFVAIEVK